MRLKWMLEIPQIQNYMTRCGGLWYNPSTQEAETKNSNQAWAIQLVPNQPVLNQNPVFQKTKLPRTTKRKKGRKKNKAGKGINTTSKRKTITSTREEINRIVNNINGVHQWNFKDWFSENMYKINKSLFQLIKTDWFKARMREEKQNR